MKQQRLSQVHFETASSQARKKRQYIAVRGEAKGGDKMGGNYIFINIIPQRVNYILLFLPLLISTYLLGDIP